MKGKLKKALIILAAVLVILAGGSLIYFGVYYHADATAERVLAGDSGSVKIEEEDGYTAYIPEHPEAGLIFYQGAKVDEDAYAPLMEKLAERGILCVVPAIPERFAFFGINSADGIQEDFTQVSDWYMGGHSLGGVAASMYVSRHADEFCGLILFASYSTKDLSESGLKVMSIYGDQDDVLNEKQYANNMEHLPSDLDEVVIEGGCHGYFGDYGEQKGDGTPTITREEQQKETADAVALFIQKGEK